MNDNGLAKSQIFYYSILAFPLAFVGLPIYINISDFYAKKFELDLSLIAILLILVRAIDLIQDPFIGYFSDSLARKKFSRKKIIYLSSLFLALSFFFLFNPPDLSSNFIISIWFFVCLAATYTFFNFSTINFESIAAIIANNKSQRIAINSSKEFFGLIGVLFASITPFALIKAFGVSTQQSYFLLAVIFSALIVFIVLGFFRKVEVAGYNIVNELEDGIVGSYKKILKNKKFTFFLVIFLFNSIAVSIPSATIIFYVEDVLNSKNDFGVFLAIYFLSGVLFIGFWKFLAQKIGKITTWNISIFGSVLTFIFAYFLDANSANYFYLVCFLSGAFLGADLIIPPALIADICENKKNQISSYFSLWNVTIKMGLMIASSSSLLILDFYQYQPQVSFSTIENETSGAISFVYAILPSILKILVIFLLFPFKKLMEQDS